MWLQSMRQSFNPDTTDANELSSSVQGEIDPQFQPYLREPPRISYTQPEDPWFRRRPMTWQKWKYCEWNSNCPILSSSKCVTMQCTRMNAWRELSNGFGASGSFASLSSSVSRCERHRTRVYASVPELIRARCKYPFRSRSWTA